MLCLKCVDDIADICLFTVETIAFVLAVLVVTYTVQDGKSNYLEGAMVSDDSRTHLSY